MEGLLSHPFILFSWWLAITIIIGALITRFIRFSQRILVVIYRQSSSSPRWNITIIHAVGWVLTVMLWIVISSIIASRLGIPSALIAGLGTVLGAAIGFGSQEIVRDIVKGTVHLLEKQFAVGDFVSLTVSGVDNMGVVEEVSLRAVVISTENDGLVTVPQGYISVVKNYSIGEGKFVINLPFDTDVSIQSALSTLREVCTAVNSKDPIMNEWVTPVDRDALHSIISTTVRGVSSVDTGSIVMQVAGVARPGQHFSARRALLRALSYRLDDEDIQFKSAAAVIPRV